MFTRGYSFIRSESALHTCRGYEIKRHSSCKEAKPANELTMLPLRTAYSTVKQARRGIALAKATSYSRRSKELRAHDWRGVGLCAHSCSHEHWSAPAAVLAGYECLLSRNVPTSVDQAAAGLKEHRRQVNAYDIVSRAWSRWPVISARRTASAEPICPIH